MLASDPFSMKKVRMPYRYPKSGRSGCAFRLASGVAALPWNQWQLSCGMGGRLPVESVANLEWNTHIIPSFASASNFLDRL